MYNNDNAEGRFSSQVYKVQDSAMRENIDLPKLPPLKTRSSYHEFTDIDQNNNISIGWTPVSGVSSGETRISPATPLRRAMSSRPPPPPLPNHYSISSSPLHITPTRTKTPTSTTGHISPFVSEPDISYIRNISLNDTMKDVSPFIGEYERGYSFSSPRKDDQLSDNFGNTIKSFSHISSFNGNIVDSPTFYERPPLPKIPPTSRNISGNSKASDSIESCYSDSNYTFNNSNARHSSFNSLLGGKPLDLVPSITAPSQPFSINLLDENKLYQCYSVYKLTDIYEWILKVYFEWFNECVFGKLEFFQMIQLLLEFQMPKNFDQDTIDSNVDKIIESLVLQKAVRFEIEMHENNDNKHDDEITIIVAGLDISGIFTELLPCYSFSDTTYSQVNSTVCYSNTCFNRVPNDSREELKLSEIINKSVGLWTEYWKLTPEMLAEINPREIQRQSFIFDLIILEERSLNMANAAVEIYGRRFDPDLLPNEPNFSSYAFDIFLPLIQLHKEFLLTPIFWKLQTRGKFIDSIGKIYLKWCNEARNIYLNYANSMATVHEIITWEKHHQTKFAQWLTDIDNLPEISRSKMYYDVIFFGGFFKSLQNIPVTLQSILKNTDPSVEDYEYLVLVKKEIENLGAEVDHVHGAAIDRRKLVRFSKQLVFNSSNNYTVGYVNLSNGVENMETNFIQDKLDLGLTDSGRKLLMDGTVLKKRELWLESVPVYIALLDNYFLITEKVIKGHQERFKLIERPIPIEYLNLEQHRSNIDGYSNAGGSTRESLYKNANKSATQLVSTPINAVRPHLRNAASTVTKTLYSSPAQNLRGDDSSTEISNFIPGASDFGFKVRNLATNESFTFYNSSLDERERWMDAFMACFKQLRTQTISNIFDLSVVSTQFAYSYKDAPVNLPVAPEGSEIDKALKAYENKTQNTQALIPMTTTVFCTIHIDFEGKLYILMATENGIYMRCEEEKNKNFVKILNCSVVKKMEVNLKLGLVFVLDSRRLCYYNIPSLLGAYYSPRKYLFNNRVIGILVRDKVGCFKSAEDFGNSRNLIYERKGKIVLLTPEYDRLNKSLKFYKFYKEYNLPTVLTSLTAPEIQDIVVFKKCFIVCTSKGSIIYNDSFNDEGIMLPTFLNDKDMYSYMKQNHINQNPFKTTVESSSKKDSSKQKMAEYVKKDIAAHKTKPIACFHINNSTNYVMVYDEAVIMMNQFGAISNWKHEILVLDFYCTGASMINGYLILVGDNLVQIYDLNSEIALGKLAPVQIIKGKKVKLVSSKNIDEAIISLSHPNIPNRQLILAVKLAHV